MTEKQIEGQTAIPLPATAASQPQRVQLSRRKGWRKPDGAVVVARPSRWGNPYLLGRYTSRSEVVQRYRHGIEHGWDGFPTVETIRDQLAGHDLACWCPLDQPCHADVLLDIANTTTLEGTQ